MIQLVHTIINKARDGRHRPIESLLTKLERSLALVNLLGWNNHTIIVVNCAMWSLSFAPLAVTLTLGWFIMICLAQKDPPHEVRHKIIP